ncbi:aminomethyl-transferring glycine dehydrogenase subunit GcvPB [bacterium]|nr:aminomethyl-transferring glycine dehydrogenase subunit GcvPB [bacterium]
MPEKLIFEISKKGKAGATLPHSEVPSLNPSDYLEEHLLRKNEIGLPEVSEVEAMRHFVNLSTKNHHVDKGFYPLGSCTMKYNPKINEKIAMMDGFSGLHPLSPPDCSQGALQIMRELDQYLCEIGGMDAVTLQPAAGAHGELTGLLIIRAHHIKNGNPRKKVLIPDSSHGTNPASINFAGYEPIQIQSGEGGLVDLARLETALNPEVAAIMITNPNTLGLFEKDILKVSELAHRYGVQMYMDGANLNACMGIVRPGDVGFDVVHFNLHKTFSTPHGGGGPGSGPVGVKAHLKPYLPLPVIEEKEGKLSLNYDRPESIGKIQAFWGAFGVMVKAYTYIRMLGAEGLKKTSEDAVLNANYLYALIKEYYDLGYPGTPMHEFVVSGLRYRNKGVKTLDIAKRLLDFGYHAPTIYFPLIVSEALMIEPTETESKDSIEDYARVLIEIAREAETNPQKLHDAPFNTPVRRLDERKAATDLILTWKDLKKNAK